MNEYTDEQLLAGISNALEAQDLEVVTDILKVLAVQNPDAAQRILDAVNGKFTITLGQR